MVDIRKGHKRISIGKITESILTAPGSKPLDRYMVLERLEHYLVYDKRYSKTSVKCTINVSKYLLKHYDISKLDQDTARMIEEDLRSRGRKNTTIAHKLEALMLIAASQGIDLKVKKPKLIKRERPALSVAEAKALLLAADNIRDRAIISVLLYSGIRSKELLALDIDDLDVRGRVLHVRDHGEGIKNYHERKAVLSQDCIKMLNEWIAVRPQDCEKALFLNVHGMRLTNSGLHKIISNTGKRAGIGKRVYTHLLRHTAASTMIKQGIPVTEVMLQLGHRSLASTMVYLHGDMDGLKASIDQKFVY